MKITVKNNGKAPQGVHTRKGVIWVKPGGEREMEVSDHHLERVKAMKHLKHEVVEGGGDPNPEDEFEAATDDELRAFLTNRDGKPPHPNAKRETLLAKAREAA